VKIICDVTQKKKKKLYLHFRHLVRLKMGRELHPLQILLVARASCHVAVVVREVTQGRCHHHKSQFPLLLGAKASGDGTKGREVAQNRYHHEIILGREWC
jgi:hypothetical protein